MKIVRRMALAIWVSLVAVCMPAAAQGLNLACVENDVDLPATKSIHNGEATAGDADTIAGVLGFADGQDVWTAGEVPRPPDKPAGKAEPPQEHTFQYLVAFSKPVTVGTIVCGLECRYLKPDAPYPGDPNNVAQWVTPAVRPMQWQPYFITLPAGTQTRAILCMERRTSGASKLPALWLLKDRLHNILPGGVGNAREEYTRPKYPHTYAAADVATASGAWLNSGLDKLGRNLRPPITDLDPCWFVLSWPQKRAIKCIFVQDNFADIKLYSFIGAAGLNPAVGTDAEWKWQRAFTQVRKGGGRWIEFNDPIVTRGVKFLILKTAAPQTQVATITAMHVLTDIGTEPVPEPGKRVSQNPPLSIPCKLDAAGMFTMVVDRADGTRARNLVARVGRPAGNNAEYWDLKDEFGQFVQPGAYRWKAITWQPLGIRYEMTAYPNVTAVHPDRAAWLTGAYGPNGWMADHTPPRAVAVSGDRVYLGSPVSESGVSLIECDLTGKKLWAYPSFAGFTGVWWLAADTKTVYVGASACNTAAEWKVEPESEVVWGVDIESKQVRTVALLQPTSTRKRGIQGMAARDGQVFISVRSDQGWLQNAAQAADVDVERCVPRYLPKRKERYAYEVVPDPRGDFLRLFRLLTVPPGLNKETSLTYLESTKGPGDQYIIVPFQKPISLGSIVYPVPQGTAYNVRLSILKENAPYPPNAEDESQWQAFENSGTLAWDCVPAPKNAKTRALRITFYKGAGDVFSDIENAATAGGGVDNLLGADIDKEDKNEAGVAADEKGWLGQLEGMKLLRRRYVNLFASAAVRVSSGHVDQQGVWDAERDRPLSEADPAIYAMQWAEPQSLRGLAINEIDGARTEIDVYTGDAKGQIDIASKDGWEHVGTHRQGRRNHWSGTEGYNGQARYLDGYVDFGKDATTRAVRLRVVEQWPDNGDRGLEGGRADRAAREIDARRCHVYGVAPLQYIGGEDPVDPLITDRIEVCDAATGKITHEIAIEKPGPIALAPDGSLFTISGGKLLRVDPAGKDHKPIPTDLEKPEQIACDQKGNLYVYDAAEKRQTVRAYDQAGTFLRAIGAPGGYKAGPWDPTRLTEVTGLAADKLDQLWVVQTNYFPKRITLWSTSGSFKQEFLGNTPYGGAGNLDPYDKTRMFFGPLEFELNWERGTTRLKNLTYPHALGWEAGDMPTRIDGRTYLTTPKASGNGPAMSAGIVYLYEKDHLRPVAAMGNAGQFSLLRKPEIDAALAYKPLPEQEFLWCDLSGDGAVQPNEVEFWPSTGAIRVVNFNRDLGMQAGKLRFEVKEFLPNGVPVYKKTELPGLRGGPTYRLDNGNFWCMEEERIDGFRIEIMTREGKPVWSYLTEGPGVGGLNTCKPWYPEQVVCQFGLVGHETAHAGDLGEFLVFNTNVGTWNIFTADGLLAGQIFHDQRRPSTPWSMTEHERGLNLDDITVGEEHFAGHFCKTPDNKYYCVAGHNHASVVEVLGLDKYKRLTGEFTVTPEQLVAAQEWENEFQKERVYQRAPVMECWRLKNAPAIDGDSSDWGFVSAEMDDANATFRMGYDDKYLFLCYETRNMGPLKNSGQQWDRLFKTGASVDLQLALDPEAPVDRKAPVAGDLRLLMTFAGDEPAAVLYNAAVPGTPPDKVWVVSSPVGKASFDVVKKLTGARMVVRHEIYGVGYTIEAAVPLAEIGLKPKPGLRLKADWGVLASGKDGNEVVRRAYWANKATSCISDSPTEARLHPALWGFARFVGQHEDMLDKIEPGKDAKEAVVDDFLQDVIEDAK